MMINWSRILIFAPLVTACAHGAAGPACPPGADFMQQGGGASLDGERQDGRIRAEGLAGLISVPGTLHFENGELIWSSQGDTDRGRYVARVIGDGRIEFRSVHVIERGERVYWHGLREADALSGVTAYWVREPGDAVHDALLADCVRLHFTGERE